MSRDRESMRRYARAMSLLESGDSAAMKSLAQEFDGFPEGVDPYLRGRWIVHAICSGSAETVRWMLERGVELDFREDDGYTALHVALERDRPDRLELLALLLRSGAPVNRKGLNDWTPAHMAAARDDVDALRILVRHGADL